MLSASPTSPITLVILQNVPFHTFYFTSQKNILFSTSNTKIIYYARSEFVMQKPIPTSSSINSNPTTTTGPIHLPPADQTVAVEVQHLVKAFGKHKAVND